MSNSDLNFRILWQINIIHLATTKKCNTCCTFNVNFAYLLLFLYLRCNFWLNLLWSTINLSDWTRIGFSPNNQDVLISSMKSWTSTMQRTWYMLNVIHTDFQKISMRWVNPVDTTDWRSLSREKTLMIWLIFRHN